MVYHQRMRISWRDLDWISEDDRSEISRRMELLDNASGLLERVDFSGHPPGSSGAFEIRITANAAKRQIIAVRRDSQRARAFNSAFEALERGIVSVLSAQCSQPSPARPAVPAAVQARPAAAAATWIELARPKGWFAGRGVRAALATAGLLGAVAVIAPWSYEGPRAVRPSPVREATVFSAVAKISAEALDSDAAFSAVARLGSVRRR